MSNLCTAERLALVDRLVGLGSLVIDICVSANKDGATGVPTDGAYAPQSITLSDTGETMGHTAVTFPAMATNIDVGAFVIRTSGIGGTPRIFGAFDATQSTLAGVPFSIAANALTLTTAPG